MTLYNVSSLIETNDKLMFIVYDLINRTIVAVHIALLT
jgi:hypothetical protein